MYAQARYLDPALGRFLSADPLVGTLDDPFSTQGFAYARANPLRFIDPDGRQFVGIDTPSGDLTPHQESALESARQLGRKHAELGAICDANDVGAEEACADFAKVELGEAGLVGAGATATGIGTCALLGVATVELFGAGGWVCAAVLGAGGALVVQDTVQEAILVKNDPTATQTELITNGVARPVEVTAGLAVGLGAGRVFRAAGEGTTEGAGNRGNAGRTPPTAPEDPVLNLGSGQNRMPGAVNVDIRPAVGVDVVADASRLPFADQTFGEVHVINPYGFDPVSPEVARLLKPGGTLRVTGTPRNPYVQEPSAEALQAAGLELVEVTPMQEVHNFGVQRTTSGGELKTGKSRTFVYRKLP